MEERKKDDPRRIIFRKMQDSCIAGLTLEGQLKEKQNGGPGNTGAILGL